MRRSGFSTPTTEESRTKSRYARQPRGLEDGPHGAIGVRDHARHEPGALHAAERRRRLGIGPAPEAHGRVVGAAPLGDRLDLVLARDAEVVEHVAEVARVGRHALRGGARDGQVRVQADARPELGLVDARLVDGVAAAGEIRGDDGIVHLDQRIARVEDDGPGERAPRGRDRGGHCAAYYNDADHESPRPADRPASPPPSSRCSRRSPRRGGSSGRSPITAARCARRR